MSLTDQKIINPAVTKLENLTGGSFHGYRSEVWDIIAAVVKTCRASQKQEKSKIKKCSQIPCNNPVAYHEPVTDTYMCEECMIRSRDVCGIKTPYISLVKNKPEKLAKSELDLNKRRKKDFELFKEKHLKEVEINTLSVINAIRHTMEIAHKHGFDAGAQITESVVEARSCFNCLNRAMGICGRIVENGCAAYSLHTTN